MLFSPDLYVRAMRFAATRHAGQTVADAPLPYLVHVVAVAAEFIAALPLPGVDADLGVACALLHDTVEDTATTLEEVADQFGRAVADGVLALTKNEQLPKAEQMADALRRIREQPPTIWAVKLADRITNLAPPPETWSTEKRRAYRAEARIIAEQLAGPCPALDARIQARIAAYEY